MVARNLFGAIVPAFFCWSNDGKSKEAGVRESEALGYADRKEVEADAGSGLAKGDEARSAVSIGPQEGGLGTSV